MIYILLACVFFYIYCCYTNDEEKNYRYVISKEVHRDE